MAPVLIISVNKKINIHIPGRLGFGTEDLCSYIVCLASILCLRDWKRKGHDKAQTTHMAVFLPARTTVSLQDGSYTDL